MALHPQLQRCYDLAMRGSWTVPFFLVPLGHVEWHEADPNKVPTAAMFSRIIGDKAEINLHINTKWIATIADNEVFGVLAHEMLHAMLRHHERSGGKEREKWAIAADMAINASLQQADIRLPSCAILPPPKYRDLAAEQLYELLENQEIQQPQGYDPQQATAGCSPQEGQGESENGQGEGEGQGNSPGEGMNPERVWGELSAQSQAYARGTGSFQSIAKLFARAPVKTNWKALMKRVSNRAAAKGGRDDQSYKRVNRRNDSPDIILPGWLSHSPSLAVIVDSSGSVTDEMFAFSLNSIISIAETTKVRIFLALHDGRCYWKGWINPEVSVAYLSSLATNRGGTCPREAFEAVEQSNGKFDTCVYLTDGEVGVYPDRPLNVKKMLVGIVGDGRHRTPTPAGWQEVLVECKD